ncbi:hypothetical protein E1264_15285 [Actinomadura sp. KC216]|uniref:hypothetical protein n=1 Tax=Actinomadura sp. KC216 TaxID=2530370 RepID=UPI00104CEFA3|nr:hypothetical protein [Actinomadura sp. KC216]TDB87218.1 hypothetical protein E1264_15285 [Actinomadura sp. KC216]
MSFDRHPSDRNAARDLDEDTAEDLLTGIWRDPETATHPVAGLLAAATAPPTARELRGEDAAAAAFRQARLESRRRGRLGRTAHRALLEIVTAKVVIALAVAGTAAGGAALAANTGHLPVLESPPRSPAPASPPATTKATRPAPPPGQPRHGPPGASTAPGTPHSSALAGLCRSFLALERPGRGRKPTVPPRSSAAEFAPLVAAAGGHAKVAGYCEKVLSGKQHKKPDDPSEKKPKGPPGKEKKKDKPGKKKEKKAKRVKGD